MLSNSNPSIDKSFRKLDNKCMNLLKKMKEILCSFENLFMKEHECLSCLREIKDGSTFQLCDKCLKDVQFLNDCVCAKCGEKLNKASLVCDLCKDKDYVFDKNISSCYYTDVPAKIVKRFKFHGKKYYAEYIAKIMLENNNCFDGVDIITFVPLSKSRMRERGFNQAEEIAKILSESKNIPILSLLVKTKEGKHQSKLNQQERLQNLRDSFSVKEDARKLVKNKTVLIVDDVFTTGTTLNECSKVLKAKGAKQIFTTTFAKTKFNSMKN